MEVGVGAYSRLGTIKIGVKILEIKSAEINTAIN